MTHLEHAKQLRQDPGVHYNCFQATIMPFAEEYGLSQETAFRMGMFLNAGMHCGSICGTLAGALAVLGLSGKDGQINMELLRRFQEKHGTVTCPELLKAAAQRGEQRKAHCDGLVYELVETLEELTK